MKSTRLLIAAAAAAAIAGPVLAAGQTAPVDATMRLLQRVATQYAVLMARSFVDLTYDSIAIEPGTNNLIVTGLRLYPDLDWDEDGACEIDIDRVVVADTNTLEKLGSDIEVAGVSMPAACFQPEVAGTLAGLGYDGLRVDGASIGFSYDLPSSSADLDIEAAVADAADIGLSAHFDYFWFHVPTSGEPDAMPEPVARLGSAELVIDNRGLWQKLEPTLAQQMGDLQQIPQAARMMVTQLLTDGGTRAPSAEEKAFIDNLTQQIARFIQQKNRIVVSFSPKQGSVPLTSDLFASPGAAIAALNPVISGTPQAYRRLVAPANLTAALAGGGNMDDKTRLAVARALVTGIGAPRSVDTARKLIQPLADEWNPEAALLAAQAAQAAGDNQAAYAMALRAMTGGQTAATAIADELEATLPLVAVLGAQADAAKAWPNAQNDKAAADKLVSTGDVAGMRRRAYAAASGRGRPRNYAQAYYWASLAAAAGDSGAAGLRQRLDERFASQDGWRDTASSEATRALDTWTQGGLGQIIASRAGK